MEDLKCTTCSEKLGVETKTPHTKENNNKKATCTNCGTTRFL